MTQINLLELPDELYTQIRGMALTQSRSINERIVTLLQRALNTEMQRQSQGASRNSLGAMDTPTNGT